MNPIGELIKHNRIYNLREDYRQERPVQDPVLEQKLVAALMNELVRHDAPEEQFIRLGLSTDVLG
ncbi:hypothetical protein EDC14_105021 [Hydrogenispora ethanolica]|uniref:Uncharacterized protein n=1 Tax=Hydrogenispora ethanolica TaxID=1082276 RepID=A0A4R1QSL2_HYDET|nr:hypothetical protein EDC14_105021 [Hydrogenispora ethanolica]